VPLLFAIYTIFIYFLLIYKILQVDLEFQLGDEKTIVTSKIGVSPGNEGEDSSSILELETFNSTIWFLVKCLQDFPVYLFVRQLFFRV
jgi:hypothetical protein